MNTDDVSSILIHYWQLVLWGRLGSVVPAYPCSPSSSSRVINAFTPSRWACACLGLLWKVNYLIILKRTVFTSSPSFDAFVAQHRVGSAGKLNRTVFFLMVSAGVPSGFFYSWQNQVIILRKFSRRFCARSHTSRNLQFCIPHLTFPYSFYHSVF